MKKAVKRAGISLIVLSLFMGMNVLAKNSDGPSVAGRASIREGETKKLSIKKNGYKIKNVEAFSSNTEVVRVRADRDDVTLTGEDEGRATVTTYIKAKKKGKKVRTFSVKTSVTVEAEDPTEEPVETEEPDETPNPTKTPKPTKTPRPTATPRPTSTPRPTATPRPTSTPRPTATARPSTTPRPTRTPRPTSTPRPTQTPVPTPTPTQTPVPTPTPTQRPTGSICSSADLNVSGGSDGTWDITVSFSGLKDDGTVYLVGGDSESSLRSDLSGFDGSSRYVIDQKSVSVGRTVCRFVTNIECAYYAAAIVPGRTSDCTVVSTRTVKNNFLTEEATPSPTPTAESTAEPSASPEVLAEDGTVDSADEQDTRDESDVEDDEDSGDDEDSDDEDVDSGDDEDSDDTDADSGDDEDSDDEDAELTGSIFTNGEGGISWVLLLVIFVILLGLVGAGAYIVIKKKPDDNNSNTDE